MARRVIYPGTILIVAGFIATAIVADPESAEERERLRESAAGIDGVDRSGIDPATARVDLRQFIGRPNMTEETIVIDIAD